MDALATTDQQETAFSDFLKTKPIPVPSVLDLIQKSQDPNQRSKWISALIQALYTNQEFDGLYVAVRAFYEELPQGLLPTQIRDYLMKICKNRMDKAFLKAADFGGRNVPLSESIRRFDLLRSMKPGLQIIDKAWGFGVVTRIDDFYSKVTVDFTNNPHHGLSFSTVCETVSIASPDHLYTKAHNHPDEIADMKKNSPKELVKLTLKSFGNMSVQRLETVLKEAGLVTDKEWKNFWSKARTELKKDKLVELPARRSENIILNEEVETYGDEWFEAFAENHEPDDILKKIDEVVEAREFKNLTEEEKGKIQDRLYFALKAAENASPERYAKIAVKIYNFGLDVPSAEQAAEQPADESADEEMPPTAKEMREALWEDKDYITAAKGLSVKDIKLMVEFLLQGENKATAQETFLEDLPEMPYSLLNEVLLALKNEIECKKRCIELLNQPKAPYTLVKWLFANRKELFKEQPKKKAEKDAGAAEPTEETENAVPEHLIESSDLLRLLLGHAIAMMENSLAGEDLRMQNYIKECFNSNKWLEGIFKELNANDKVFLFERIQASHAWDPSSHRTLLGRMLEIDKKTLQSHKIVKKAVKVLARLTSWRSFKERQQAYAHLIEVELPKNSNDIAVARGYGDLSENFEYESAKDLQRQLHKRQEEYQKDLKAVKGTDFANAPTDKVGPGTTVTIRLEDETTAVYTILGEWDSDEDLNIISNRTRMAKALMGKSVGEKAMTPSASGDIPATIEKIEPLSETIKAWIATDPSPIKS